jgi:HTH-type transcriptional repressor of NAD biosynthesis genes
VTRGLVVGKFYPLHKGHLHLLDEATRRSDDLWVVVSDDPNESVPAQLRANWIREMYPQAHVRVTPYDIPDAPGPWVERCTSILPGLPDLVFTSEAYGHEFAALLGAAHMVVDRDRRVVSISGTMLRRDLGSHFTYLAPPAAAFLAKRICVVGVESSGTTALAQQLAAHYATVWVPEYGRWYWEGRRYTADTDVWATSEFVAIAEGQITLEDRLAERANRLVVADTDALATHVWHRRYMGRYSEEVWKIAEGRHCDLRILTEPDFPFVQDGTREGEYLRHEMHGWFLDALDRSSQPFISVGGSPDERIGRAVAAIDVHLRFPQLAESSPLSMT